MGALFCSDIIFMGYFNELLVDKVKYISQIQFHKK